jgi:hypothetical protein
MRSLLIAVVLSAVAAPAAALDLPPLCQAMHGLADAARNGGQPQRLAIRPDGCAADGDSAAGRAFCAASGAGQADAADAMPWELLRTCLNSLAAEPQVTTAGEGDIGPRHRKRVSHIAAKLGHGVRLDLAYSAGRYDLVVWAPK